MALLSRLIRMANSLKRFPNTKEFTLKTLIKLSKLILRQQVVFFVLEQLSIVIPSVGEVKPHLFTEASTAGSLKLLKSRSSLSNKTKQQSGFQISFKRRDSTTGLLTLKTGVSQEIDTGEILSRFGFLMTVRRSCVLVQSRNSKNFQDKDHSLISIENTLTTFRSLQSKAKVCSREFRKYSTAGLKVEPCLSLNAITHLQQRKKNL